MDPDKSSLTSKTQHVSSREGSESPMDEMGLQSVDGERQREMETKEPDAVDSVAADINVFHKGAADKQKFSTIGFQRRTKQKVVTDFATLSKGTSAGAKTRTPLKQVFFSQGVSDKVSEERVQLDVLKQALEASTLPVNRWRWKEESQGTTLEKSWTDIVHSTSTMSKMQRHQQEALWEFVHTELAYINKLLIIRDLVIAALVNLHQHGFLLEVTPELLFSNLPAILSAHQLFWQEVIYPMLQEVRKTGKPFDPMWLEAGCLQFQERFSCYHHYCWEEENNLEFSRRQMESSPHFFTYVQWVENHPQGERMRLGDMQAKPHQRITKYPLLLKAVLKHTQDPHVQHALRGMLSSVKDFLESINEYMRVRDEELALSISAQRVEGYEVEGINEEIDKHVREICQFDLTCPIRGVGPGVMRKLLLEENLRFRGRKDSKLEFVALLFSDVLLFTKVQKKAERLKVVRPPLALDRTYCIALKDGYSFVLVEVGELQSAMNVLILVTSTTESCSLWVSAIHQAKETLRKLRETENSRLETLKINQQDEEAVTDDMETEDQPVTHPGMETSMDEFSIIAHSVNGSEAAEQYRPLDDVSSEKSELLFQYSQSKDSTQKFGHKRSPLQPPAFTEPEWIEMGVRQDHAGNQGEKEHDIVETQITDEQSVTWNHSVQSAPLLNDFTHRHAASPFGYNTIGLHNFLPGGLPDVDYPTNEDTTLQPNNQPVIRKGFEFLRQQSQRETLRKDFDSVSVNQGKRRNSSVSLFGDTETAQQAWVSRNLKSPSIQRRRPVSTKPSPSQTSKEFFQGWEQTSAASNNYSSSNSGSNCNPKMKRNSLPTYPSNSQRVLRLGSLRSNPGMFSSESPSPDPQAFSESELPGMKFQNKKPKMKTHRSSSTPTMSTERGARISLPSRSSYTPSQAEGSHPSPLQGLLDRAKEREKERGGLKKDRNLKMSNPRSGYPPPSPSFSATPSPPCSDGDRDTEWEEVEVTRHRALTVSQGWKEQLVDGDEDEQGNSVMFTDGENVDWAGWCFDDEEVMDHLHPGRNSLMEELNQYMASWVLSELSEQEDGECSQV
ncbi:uncharacterized protein plekhg6 [Archocentrus centrarchus]|uniref:uncharacterized protein plekhg6 n=1 Tax=Archocentrus centrarchus TaxID=63155 RepID=UPI0011E9DD5B|nr:pleckstrin homology domain-containing family G member 6 [Archocentrus centrarchus]